MLTYITVFGRDIPSYGLLMSFALLLCSFLAFRQIKRHGLLAEDFIIISAVSLGTGLLGGGLLYLLVTYSPAEILYMLQQGDFTFLTSGGLVFFGGLLGGISGGLVTCRILRQDISLLERCIVPYLPLGHAIGRVGCLLAGCCHGREYEGLFSVHNYALSATASYFPVQLLEAACNLFLAWFLSLYARNTRAQYHILCHYLVFYSVIRFHMEWFRGDLIRGGFLCFSTSQWISIVLFGIGLGKICYDNLKNKGKRCNQVEI